MSTTPTDAARARRTRQRSVVQYGLADYGDFISAQGLHARLTGEGVGVGLTTVYRVLRHLERTGQVDTVRDDITGKRLYRTRPDSEHRHYVICRHCGRSEAVDADVVEDWARRLDAVTGFSDVDHTLELSGRCGECRPHADDRRGRRS
ncbi:Fur family transcriptional regulator [Streptomyces iconiensis]|uniref:Transcriptional repressor n=1 Tax=Streptomyces iconiensis TaxID=1384038 RepID=A0ABT6ZSX7_9ACTN|nr:transcriptional repressor [Streptomyces iconiensis]MDJ1132173.1 transcriptional repressor [Streptomyces iconiensis]